MEARRHQILVSNLPTFMTTDEFWDFVDRKTVGVLDVKLLREDKGSPVIERCALVTYQRRLMQWDAEMTMNQTVLLGNRLRAARVLETEFIRGERGDRIKLRGAEDREMVRTFKSQKMCYVPNRYLYVSNISPNTTYDDLYRVFQKYGNVVNLKIKQQGSLRYAYVGYKNLDQSLNAFIKLQGLRLRKRLLFVSYLEGNTSLKERGLIKAGRLKLNKSPIYRTAVESNQKAIEQPKPKLPESNHKTRLEGLSNLVIPKKEGTFLPGIDSQSSPWKPGKAIKYSGDNFMRVRNDFKVYVLDISERPHYLRDTLHSKKRLPSTRQAARALRKKVV